MGFNPLDHPLALAYPAYPLRGAAPSLIENFPLAMLLVDLLRPSTLVEVGASDGVSYCAFLQAIVSVGVECRCYALGTWQGSSGSDTSRILHDFHDPRYSAFSELVSLPLSSATFRFPDGSIDLLHVNGDHPDLAFESDAAAISFFDAWIPKMSDRGVILAYNLHGLYRSPPKGVGNDPSVHDAKSEASTTGVRSLWGELASRFPTLFLQKPDSDPHSALGIIVVGANPPKTARAFLEITEPARSTMMTLLNELGRRITDREMVIDLASQIAHLNEAITVLTQQSREASRQEQIAQEELREAVDLYERQIAQTFDVAAAERSATMIERVTLAAERRMVQEQAEAQVKQAEAQVLALSTKLATTQRQLSALVSTPAGRALKLAHASSVVLKQKGLRAVAGHTMSWLLGRRGYHLQDLPQEQQTERSAANSDRVRKALMFITGESASSHRYRCHHAAEALNFAGYTVDVGRYGVTPLDNLVDQYAGFVFHRVPLRPDVERFMVEARRKGKLLLFESDDWVFDLNAVPHIHNANIHKESAKEAISLRRETLALCDGAIVSTEPLRELALQHNPNVVVVPNAASLAMLRGAEDALRHAAARHTTPRDTVTIGYFSGTPTHNRDFLEAADSILWALDRYPSVTFKVIGPLALDERFERFGSRVIRLPAQRWEDLPRVYTTVDISIAPLEGNNPYTDSKSSIKHLEAALCKVPTIASPRPDFLRTITPGVNGLLADTPDEWRNTLAQLIESPERRREMGHCAWERALASETILQRPGTYHQALRSLGMSLSYGEVTRPLVVNVVAQAPRIGYDHEDTFVGALELANALTARGHSTRLYVEPVGLFEGKTSEEVRTNLIPRFGQIRADLIVGTEALAPADASIATCWMAAYAVKRHATSLSRFYFAQEFEPDLYDEADLKYVEAEQSCHLPLQLICRDAALAHHLETLTGREPAYLETASTNGADVSQASGASEASDSGAAIYWDRVAQQFEELIRERCWMERQPSATAAAEA